MSNIKISELPQATNVGTSDIVPIVQSGTTKQASVSQVAGERIIDLTSETAVRVWELDEGIYKLAHETTVYYQGATGAGATVTQGTNYLLITHSVPDARKYFFFLMGTGTYNLLRYGYSSSTTGAYKMTNFRSIAKYN